MHSYVVTGGARGIGRAIAGRLAREGQVVVVDGEGDALAWTHEHRQIAAVVGDASQEAVTIRAADTAEAAAPLADWVNNAAIFRDAWLHDVRAIELWEAITLNLALAVTGCVTAVRRFLVNEGPGAIVNISSHQGQRPVPGALPTRPPRRRSRGSRARSPSTTGRAESSRTSSPPRRASSTVRSCPWTADAPCSAMIPRNATAAPD
jgi:NAD(P)-dependent dehydrogenase (short-subunit alcohol dehydrogenase family)